jgi:hypothetical protein
MTLSVILVGVGLVTVYRQPKQCRAATKRHVAALWISTALVVLIVLLPQVFSTVLADWFD